MHTYLVLMSLVLRSGLFTAQPASRTVSVSVLCPLSSAQAGCQGEIFFLSEGTEQFPAYLLGTALLQSATCRKPATSNPPTHPCAPLYPTPPSSCCAPIKAELIKPQLIASAGGGRRRKKRWGGGGGVYNYTLAFTYHF